MFDQDVLASMTVERAIALCGEDAEPAVRHWVGESELATVPSLIITDMLPKFCAVTGPPKIVELIAGLKDAGYSAAVARWGAPAIRTDAPWPVILSTTEACFD